MAEPVSQREYWAGKVGNEWATHATRLDIMLQPMTAAAMERAAFKSGERVLDIGCGAGATSLEIARRVAPGAVTGVDISPPLLNVARERAAQSGLAASFIEADAGAATFDQPFDAAFSRFGVMFFEDPARAFAHIRTRLRADGRLTFICWRPLLENGWATTPIAAVMPMLKTPLTPPDPDAPGPFAFSNPQKVERILGDAGWRDIVITRWDGDILIGGGGTLEEAADFLLTIGPGARAIAEQNLDHAEARRRVVEQLASRGAQDVKLPAACWIVSAAA